MPRFLDLLKPAMAFIPEIKQPLREVRKKTKFKYIYLPFLKSKKNKKRIFYKKKINHFSFFQEN